MAKTAAKNTAKAGGEAKAAHPSGYPERVAAAVAVFNKICPDPKQKLAFVAEVLETDGPANMGWPLAQLEEIMRLITPSPSHPDEAKAYFRANLDKIGRCDSTEDVVVLFGSDQTALDEFCVSYLTFKQSFDFPDGERDKLVKNQNAIAKLVVEFVEGQGR